MKKNTFKMTMIGTLFAALPMAAQAGGFLFSDSDRIQTPAQAPRARTEAGLSDCQSGQCAPQRHTRIPVPPVRPTPSVEVATPRRAPLVLRFRNHRGKPIEQACRSLFVNGSGNYGPVGRKLASVMGQQPYRQHFLKSSALTPFCPKFARLANDEQRLQAWVWFWMVLANEESTCNSSLLHPTHYPDGRILNPKPGYGLFAAELYPQHRKGRGKMCQGNIRNASVQVNCAVHTMAATQLAAGRGVRWPASYWGPVRRASRQIMPNMRGFKACF